MNDVKTQIQLECSKEVMILIVKGMYSYDMLLCTVDELLLKNCGDKFYLTGAEKLECVNFALLEACRN